MNLGLWGAIRWEWLRTRLAPRRPSLAWLWQARTSAVIAAAPFGPVTGLVVLVLGLVLYAVLLARPGWVESALHAPDAALLAVGLLIGPMTLLLALARDLLDVILSVAGRLLRGGQGAPGRGPAAALRRREWADWFGVIGLFGLVYLSGSWLAASDRYLIPRLATVLHEPVNNGKCTAGGPALPSGAYRRPCFEEALQAWYTQRGSAEAPTAGRPVPLIIVASQGGASRAAVWTLSVMRQLDAATGGAFGENLFAISAVSGGALGAVSYLQAAIAHGRGAGSADWSNPRVRGMLEQLSQADLLGASVATYFLHDTLVATLRGLHPAAGLDRGRVLEGAFERHWAWRPGLGLSADQARAGLVARHQSAVGRSLPHLALNGTDRTTGRRIITSTFRFEVGDDVFPQADDLLGLLDKPGHERCEERIRDGVSLGLDVPAATAVHNAARFPFISPAGLVNTRCRIGEPGRWAVQRQVLDGGYFENYGAATALDMVHAVHRIAEQRGLHIKPIVVVISNNADSWADAAARSRREAARGRRLATRERGLLAETTACPSDPDTGPASGANQPAHGDQNRTPDSQAQATAGRGASGGSSAGVSALLPGAWRQMLGTDDEDAAATQLLAPFQGLAAVRGAQGEQALHRLRLALCADAGAPRLFHFALPRPEPGGTGSGPYAAPMNWVLNPSASRFLVEDRQTGERLSEQATMSPGFNNDFNRRQLELLRQAFNPFATLHPMARPVTRAP